MTTTRPSAEELRALIANNERDPGAYAALAEAYLALGRPREAAEVVERGLRIKPSVGGSLLAGRAYFQMHAWKEAQAHLLTVVKTDRSHGEGFLLLGEVLMRRADYDRALPVLQHAHNLDPANPTVLGMVKRARARQPLDAPAPLPQPVDIGAEAAPGAFSASARLESEPPTFIRSESPLSSPPPAAAAPPQPSPAEHLSSSVGGAGQSTLYEGGVRPRVFAPDKRKDAARESLRQSAEAGEDYLNNLLTAGLFDLPNVRGANPDMTAPKGQRWGRSAARTFTVLFVMLFLAVGSGGAWYYYGERKKAETIAQFIAKAKAEAQSGSWEDLERALEDARSAFELDRRNHYSMAVLSEIMGLSSYLYGEIQPARVQVGVEAASATITGPEVEGYRELLLARALSTLASLHESETAEKALADLRTELSAFLTKNPDDHLVRWVSARAMLAAGDRTGAEAALVQAENRGQGTILATIDRADMLLDRGKAEQAAQIYDEVLKKSPDHPLACIGRSFARSERSIESAEAMADLNVCLTAEMGPRIAAYQQLAMAYAHYFIEDYDDFAKNLASATGVDEPRFLARVALGRVLQGDFIGAGKVRANIRWYASDPEPHPLVALVDSEIFFATGFNDKAMAIAEKGDGLRAMKLRGKVYWDRSAYESAAEELRGALRIGPEDLEAQVYMAAVEMTTTRGSERKAAEDRLDKLGRRAKSRLPRHVYGEALIREGQFAQARDEFEKALADLGEDALHPLAYRSHVALAELDAREAEALRAEQPDAAETKFRSALEHLNAALKQNPSNLPALDLAGRLLLRRDPDRALQFLIEVVDAEAATAYAELAYAELLASSKNKVDRERAADAVRRAKTKGAKLEEVVRVAELVGGQALAAELGGP